MVQVVQIRDMLSSYRFENLHGNVGGLAVKVVNFQTRGISPGFLPDSP